MSRSECFFFFRWKKKKCGKEFGALVTSEATPAHHLCSGFDILALGNRRQVQGAPLLKESYCCETAVLHWSYSPYALRGWHRDHHLFIGILGIMWPGEQMGQVKPWLCRSYPLNTTNHLLHVIKMSLTRVISHAFWQMWLAGCDMTKHCLLPLCAISLEASSSLLAPACPCPGLPSSSPAPDGRHSGRTLAKADVFIFRRQNVVLLQMAVPWANGSLWHHCHTAWASCQTELACSWWWRNWGEKQNWRC